MSIFSPCSSVITARTRWPIGPMQAPLALTPGHGGVHGDLGAVPGLAGQGGDDDRAVGDLGHLEGEQLAHQVGVRARQADLRAPRPALDAHHEAAQPLAVDVLLPRHLLGQRQDALDRAEVDQHVARVAALLDDAGDDVALAAAEVAHDLLVLEVAQPLDDDLARGRGRDPAEPRRGVVELGPGLAALALRGDGRPPHGPRR